MKTHQFPFFRQVLAVSAIAAFGLVNATSVQAATVSGGSLILNLNRDALIAGTIQDNYPDSPTESFQICCRPSIYVEEFFGASATTKTFLQLRDENTPDLFDLVSDEISAVGLQFAVNGSTIDNPAGRVNQATSFNFDPNNLSGTASGSIGLGGVIRFRVDVDPPRNRVLLGDMTLEYNPALEGTTPGRSGWVITNHIGFDAGGFELFDVTSNLIGNSLSLSGNLGFGDGFDHLGSKQARLNATRMGTFSFQTTVVPVPAAFWLFFSGLGGIFLNSRSNRKLAL